MRKTKIIEHFLDKIELKSELIDNIYVTAHKEGYISYLLTKDEWEPIIEFTYDPASDKITFTHCKEFKVDELIKFINLITDIINKEKNPPKCSTCKYESVSIIDHPCIECTTYSQYEEEVK